MGKLGRVSDDARLRARRWDVIVLGSGVAGLVAAARLGAANHSVLVVEEDAARAQHPALREPFLLSGLRDQGALNSILRALNIPLIDRRRIQPERLAYQVVSPKWRVDVGAPNVTAAELAA
ncbi:MAG: FAD-dependent oxidoreductase, partial [Myxococcota bacterium]